MILCMKYEKRIKNTILVLEGGETITLKIGVVKLLDKICNVYGNTYDGRRNAIRKALGIVQKIPILINASKQEIFFPIFNLRKDVNYWINYRYINCVSSCGDHACWISFNDKKEILFPVNIKVIKAQLKRCEEYLSQIHSNQRCYDLNEIIFICDKMK